jgi:hypothetical protein
MMSASEDRAIICEEIGSGHSARIKSIGRICLAIEVAKERVDVDIEQVGGAGSTLSETSRTREGGETAAIDNKTGSGSMSSEGPHH